MINTLASINNFQALTDLNPFQVYQLQTRLNIAVPEVKITVSGELNPNTYKSFMIYKERHQFHFPTNISFQVVKHLDYTILESNVLEIPSSYLLSYFERKLTSRNLENLQNWTASLITTLYAFNITSKEEIAILLAILDYESDGYKNLYQFVFGTTKRGSSEFLKYQGKGLIKLRKREDYTFFSQKSGLINLERYPNSLLVPSIAIYFACLYWKVNNLSKYALESNFRSIVKHFDITCDSWTERYKIWQETLSHL